MSTDNTSLIARANLKEAEAAITEFDRVQAGIAGLKTKYEGVIFPVATTATDGKPRASGMWRVSAMATHPSTDSE